MNYVGFYEMEVTNVLGKKDILTIRLHKKPNLVQRIDAKYILRMTWQQCVELKLVS